MYAIAATLPCCCYCCTLFYSVAALFCCILWRVCVLLPFVMLLLLLLCLCRHTEDLIVTPFAQILHSLRSVRNNFIILTNVSSNK